MKRGPLVLIGVALLLVVAGGFYRARAKILKATTKAAVNPRVDSLRAPVGVRIRVGVVNTTRTRGLARRATQLLRDQGYDVVEMGTGGPLRDSTLVLDRSGNPAWAAKVAKILGPASRAEARPDSSRYLDVTVLLGGLWRAPTEPLNP
jgi:hypothetical protein